MRWDNRLGDETIRQDRSLGRHYHGAGGCREYPSWMRFTIPEWVAVLVVPALPGSRSPSFSDLEPTAFRCRQTWHRMYSRSSYGGECFTLVMRSGGGGWREPVSKSAYRPAGSISQQEPLTGGRWRSAVADRRPLGQFQSAAAFGWHAQAGDRVADSSVERLQSHL